MGLLKVFYFLQLFYKLFRDCSSFLVPSILIIPIDFPIF